MSQLVQIISTYGLPTVAAAAFLYIVLNGEIELRYPRKRKLPRRE